eukprot:1157803-Pelagomonas_calceolata.AAC.6
MKAGESQDSLVRGGGVLWSLGQCGPSSLTDVGSICSLKTFLFAVLSQHTLYLDTRRASPGVASFSGTGGSRSEPSPILIIIRYTEQSMSE